MSNLPIGTRVRIVFSARHVGYISQRFVGQTGTVLDDRQIPGVQLDNGLIVICAQKELEPHFEPSEQYERGILTAACVLRNAQGRNEAAHDALSAAREALEAADVEVHNAREELSKAESGMRRAVAGSTRAAIGRAAEKSLTEEYFGYP